MAANGMRYLTHRQLHDQHPASQHVVGRVCYTNAASWSNVALGAPVCNGSCKKTKCKSCKLVFSGNAIRIRIHYMIYMKCTACPEDIRDWARGAAKRAKEIRKHKDLTKDLDSKPQGDDDCATQQRIDGGLLGKKKTPRSLVDEKLADWICNAVMGVVEASFHPDLCCLQSKGGGVKACAAMPSAWSKFAMVHLQAGPYFGLE
jgi:hypothetical protein